MFSLQAPRTTTVCSLPDSDVFNIPTHVTYGYATTRWVYLWVEDYRATRGITSDMAPLIFWQTNQFRFPMLCLLATKYLCVEGSSVPSERVFSSAGDILRSERARLDPERADMLIFLKMNAENWSSVFCIHLQLLNCDEICLFVQCRDLTTFILLFICSLVESQV